MSWLDLDTVSPLLEPHHRELGAKIEAWARAELLPLPEPQGDAAGREQGSAVLRRLGESGFLRWLVPESEGGESGAPDTTACCLAREAIAAASPLADSIFALQGLGSMPITLSGNETLARRWLPQVARGEAMAAFAMTEPEAGSDVAALATLARKVDGGWVLDGHKAFISNAGLADFYCVFAQSEPGTGTKGIVCLLVEPSFSGFEFVRAQVLSSPHPLGEIAFRGCRVPEEHLLAGPGEGFKLGMKTLDRLRPTVAAAACGMAARALEEALSYAKARQQFGKPLAELQLVQQKLARMATDLAAARLLTYRAAWQARHGAGRITREAAMAKLFATEAAQRVVDDAVQILGGRGALAEHPVDRLYRSVRALRIYEGTSEIQHLVIARELLRG